MDDVIESPSTMRERVEHLEALLEQFPPVDCPLQHRFGPGVYVREMLIPAGVCATGAVHKGEHITVVVGHCWLTTEQGMQEFSGYSSFLSSPGMKRAIYAVQNTIVTTIHPNPTDERDLKKLIPQLVEAEAEELLGGTANKQLRAQGAAAQLESKP